MDLDEKAEDAALDPEELPDEVSEEVDDLSPGEDLTAQDVESLVSYTLDWSVQSLLERIGVTFDINPAFQRRDAWDPARKSLYIESLMLGLPVPQVVLAEDKERKGSFLVLDGKQRLVTMKQFAAPDAKFKAFKLRKLRFLPQLNGKTFAEIRSSLTDSEYAESLLAQPVRTTVLRGWGRPEVLYEVFVRLNQNSVSLSPQELRQALYPGPFTTWINERSSKSEEIHRARRITREDFRMRDAEMLLRSIAFMDRLEEYGGNLRKFLDDECEAGLRDWGSRQADFLAMADACELAIRRTFDVFTERNAFLRFDQGDYIRRFNIAVYDLMTTVLSAGELDDKAIESNGAEIRSGFEDLCRNDVRFSSSLQASTKTTAATGYRVATFAKAVSERTGIPLEVQSRAEHLLSNA